MNHDSSPLDALALRCALHDGWLESTPDIDAFCSSSAWGVPATTAFGPDDNVVTWSSEYGAAVFARYGFFLRPLECIWLLGTPIAAAAPERVLTEMMLTPEFQRRDWRVMVLAGIPARSAAWRPMLMQARHYGRLEQLGELRNRNIASLSGGIDGWLGRRTQKFRSNLRRSIRLGAEDGISFERRVLYGRADVEAAFRVVEAVEANSHKLASGNSILNEPMRHFVHGVMSISAQRYGVRMVVAHRDGEFVGYVFGTVYLDMYRGLQMSFDDRLRNAGLGNLLQWEMIAWLAEDGIGLYDMGAELPYKERWAELRHETMTILLRRSG